MMHEDLSSPRAPAQTGIPAPRPSRVAVGPHGAANFAPIAASSTNAANISSGDVREPFAWQRAHERLARFAASRARLDWKEGRLLIDALRSGVHLHLGFGCFGEYIERTLGYRRRWTEERLRVAEALECLPELARALRDGRTNWSIVRELTRVATAESERAWLDVTRGRTVRQIEELVAGHKPGDRPNDPFDGSLARRVLRFEVSAETFALFGEAMAGLRRVASSPIDDDAALLLLARRALGGPIEEGRASYQIGLTVCEGCARAWQEGRGEQVEVGPEMVEMATCDGQDIGRVGGPSGPVAKTESTAHVGARATQTHRARQNIPPAVRRRVIRRDGGRCVVPGCTQDVFVDIHHLVPRSEEGDHDPDTLVVLCCAHHRALHRGQLVVEGRVTTGVAFRHADGTAYGRALDPRAIAIYEQAFGALRQLGFREGDARRAIERARASAHVGAASVPSIVRQVLPLLAQTGMRH